MEIHCRVYEGEVRTLIGLTTFAASDEVDATNTKDFEVGPD